MTATRRILIVEDEEIIRATLNECLVGEDYVVKTTDCVAAALKMAQAEDFEVAICDVQLPDGHTT